MTDDLQTELIAKWRRQRREQMRCQVIASIIAAGVLIAIGLVLK